MTKVIRILVASDFLFQAGWGLIAPIFALFLTENVRGGNLSTVGLVAAAYWIAKSATQPFVAKRMDEKRGEKDDFRYYFIGMAVANVIPFFYLAATHIWTVFTLEAVRGIAIGCATPAWAAIFTRHIRKGKEAFSWSVDSTGIGIAGGISGAFGGLAATVFGFHWVFLFVGTFGLASTIILWAIRGHLIPSGHEEIPAIPKEKLMS